MERIRRGFSLIELLIVIAIIMSLSAIVTVASSAALKHARETAALAHVQTLMKAQTQFYSMKRHFAAGLGDLGPDKAKLIPEHLVAGKLGGYLFQVSGDEDGFTVRATPERQGKTGDNNYFADETMVIRCSESGVADRESDPVK